MGNDRVNERVADILQSLVSQVSYDIGQEIIKIIMRLRPYRGPSYIANPIRRNFILRRGGLEGKIYGLQDIWLQRGSASTAIYIRPIAGSHSEWVKFLEGQGFEDYSSEVLGFRYRIILGEVINKADPISSLSKIFSGWDISEARDDMDDD